MLHYTRLERLVRDKCDSLLDPFVRTRLHKTFLFVNVSYFCYFVYYDCVARRFRTLKGATTFSITTLSINDIPHNDTQHILPIEYWYAGCHYAYCRDYLNVVLNVIALSVDILNAVMLIVMVSFVGRHKLAPLPPSAHFNSSLIFEDNFRSLPNWERQTLLAIMEPE